MTDRFEKIAEVYEHLFPARPVQIDFLLASRPAAAPELFLDLACGSGNHLEALLDRGLEAWGLDLSAAMIRRFRDRRPDLGRRALCGDLRLADRILGEVLPGPPGLIYCLGNSLALLADDQAVREGLIAMRRLLHPQGRLVLQLINFDRLLPTLPNRMPVLDRLLPDGRTIRLERELVACGPDRPGFHVRMSIAGETLEERTSELVPLDRARLGALLDAAGFAERRWQGDYDGSDWSDDAPATIVVADASII
ncbi:MAG: class I SAM-dependent methyltransferase [Planctomycetes bacterium]|nr:class I SAM-dependent methyltransferase [Planctomycetota bacterium]